MSENHMKGNSSKSEVVGIRLQFILNSAFIESLVQWKSKQDDKVKTTHNYRINTKSFHNIIVTGVRMSL